MALQVDASATEPTRWILAPVILGDRVLQADVLDPGIYLGSLAVVQPPSAVQGDLLRGCHEVCVRMAIAVGTTLGHLVGQGLQGFISV